MRALRRLSFVVCLAAAGVALAPANPPPTIVTAARLVDVRTGTHRPNQALLVRDGKIDAVGAPADIKGRAPSGAATIDLGTATLLPGLIDCHAHLLDAMEAQWRPGEAIVIMLARVGAAKRALIGAQMAREALEAGVTTVRNVGHSGINGDAALRDAIDEGLVPGPRMLAATRKITPPGGQAVLLQGPAAAALLDEEFLPISGVEEARRAVRLALASGASVIKVVADDRGRVLDADEMTAIVKEAHRSGLKVAVHATTVAGIQAAIDGGVDSIEHGTDATDDQLAKMRERGIFLDPTFWPEQMLREIYLSAWVLTPEEKGQFETAITASADKGRALIRRASAARVRIAAGTDMWFKYPGKTRGEATTATLAALQPAGLSGAAVLRAITVDAADLLGWSDRVGVLEPGHFADIVAVAGDPLADASEITRIAFVMKGGHVIRNTLQAPR